MALMPLAVPEKAVNGPAIQTLRGSVSCPFQTSC